jgi:hypothetical protein
LWYSIWCNFQRTYRCWIPGNTRNWCSPVRFADRVLVVRV